jgi:hypothetical protein
MKKNITWTINEKDFKKKYLPIKFSINDVLETKINFEQKIGKKTIKKTKTEKVNLNIYGQIDNINKFMDMSLKDLVKYAKKNKGTSISFTTKIPFTACDICLIGIGETDFPEGKHRHEEEKLYKIIINGENKKVCKDCFEKYSKGGK